MNAIVKVKDELIGEKNIRPYGYPRRKNNIYEFRNGYGVCYTEDKQYYWLFDISDYYKIKEYYWTASAHYHNDTVDYYAIASNKDRKTVSMTRVIMGLDFGDERCVDHINHDVCDNRKSNLRICTKGQNQINQGKYKTNKSGCTGVHFQNNKWYAKIVYNKIEYYLGCYDDINEAIKVRKEAEEKYFGKYSYDNSIKAGEVNDLS